MQDQSGQILLIPVLEAKTFWLVIQTSQLNLTCSVWMKTKKFCPASPYFLSICSLMYLTLAATSSLQKLLAELAKFVRDEIISAVAPLPVKSLNWRSGWEPMRVGFSTKVKEKASAKKAQTRTILFIFNKICRLIITIDVNNQTRICKNHNKNIFNFFYLCVISQISILYNFLINCFYKVCVKTKLFFLQLICIEKMDSF